MTGPDVAVADRSTVEARIDEALAVYPLPPVRQHIDDDINAQMVRYGGTPMLFLHVDNVLDLLDWAAFLNLGVGADVELTPRGNPAHVYQSVRAHGTWLGWDVQVCGPSAFTRMSRPAGFAARRPR